MKTDRECDSNIKRCPEVWRFQIDLLAYFLLGCWLPSEDLKYLCSLPVFADEDKKDELAEWCYICFSWLFPSFPSVLASMSKSLLCLLDFFPLPFSFQYWERRTSITTNIWIYMYSHQDVVPLKKIQMKAFYL